PTPGSPSTSNAVHRPAAVSASSLRRCRNSVSRPTTAVPGLRVLPDATEAAPMPLSTGVTSPEGGPDADIDNDRREARALARLPRMGVLHHVDLPGDGASPAAGAALRSIGAMTGPGPVMGVGKPVPALAGADHISLTVTDLDRSERFYTEIL